jgi:Flp pilus assembly protein TadB
VEDTAQLVVTVLGAGGGGAVLLALVNGIMKWLSGASHRERERNTDLAAQRTRAIEERDDAEQERDEEAKKRREAEEHVSLLKRQLIELGVTPVERTVSINK